MAGRFVKPTIAELRAYAREIRFYTFDPERFLDHYETVGWVVGKARLPMKNWQAAVRTWRRNQQEWNGAPAARVDPPEVLEYAKQARHIIEHEKGYEIGRFWAKVADALGQDALERVKALANRKPAQQGGM